MQFYQAGFLVADRNGTRSFEGLFKALTSILPVKYSGIPVETIAIAMRRDAEHKLDSLGM